MIGVSLEGLMTVVFPATSEAAAIPHRIASEKFHGGITTPTPSGRYASRSFSPGHLHRRVARQIAQHLARVELAEVDRFGGLGLGFRPGLARLVDQPRVELELALPQNGGGAQQPAAPDLPRGSGCRRRNLREPSRWHASPVPWSPYGACPRSRPAATGCVETSRSPVVTRSPARSRGYSRPEFAADFLLVRLPWPRGSRRAEKSVYGSFLKAGSAEVSVVGHG